MKYRFDAVIIGGGASGLMCAIAAKKKNPSLEIAIIEKNDRVGKKLLSTGNGRCNLTNDNVGVDRYVGSADKLLSEVIKKYNTEKLIEYFESLGLQTVRDSEGRYYPMSRQASTVLDVLRFNCDELGVNFYCGETIRNVKKQKSFVIKTGQNEFEANKLVVAAGSKAAPKLGGNGSAADILKNLGHSFAPFTPALCPVKVSSDVLKPLKGLRANASVTLYKGSKPVKTESGEVQFNEDNLSGICVFDLSLFTSGDNMIAVDLTPDISEKELSNILLSNKARFSKQSADNIFTGILQKRLAQAVLKSAGVKDFSRACTSFSESELKAAAQSAKQLIFKVIGNEGFDRAQACRGGVVGEEIDPETMQSKITKNLYICGEAIDVCGECGGYNLHFAFAGGIIAGEHL